MTICMSYGSAARQVLAAVVAASNGGQPRGPSRRVQLSSPGLVATRGHHYRATATEPPLQGHRYGITTVGPPGWSHHDGVTTAGPLPIGTPIRAIAPVLGKGGGDVDAGVVQGRGLGVAGCSPSRRHLSGTGGRGDREALSPDRTHLRAGDAGDQRTGLPDGRLHLLSLQ